MDCVVYGNGRFVAFGEYSDYGVILTSEDAKNWTLRSDGINSGLSYSIGLCYTGGRFFALGGFGTSGVSSDGVTWNIISFPNYANASGVAYGASLYVAVYGTPPISGIAGSGDGINWTNLAMIDSLGDIAYGFGRFVAIGINSRSGQTYASSTGRTWTQRTIPGGSQINFQNGIFIVPFGAGTNLVSVDGLNWAVLGTGVTLPIGRILYSHGIFLARAGSFLVTSTDGTNWIQYANALPGNSLRPPTVATDGVRLVTVEFDYHTNADSHYDGYIYTSADLFSFRLIGRSPPALALSGLIGQKCGVDYANELRAAGSGSTSWNPLTTFRLSANPMIITDNTATNLQQRFYRGVLLP